MTDSLPDAARVMAEMSKHDLSIKLGDIINYSQDVSALRDWAEGNPFEPEVVKALLVKEFPHLKDR